MNLAKKMVLVVDDFQNMRSTLRQMLMSIGFEHITPVATGEDALAALRARRFDIVLCDYNLGEGIDGQQLLDQARAEGAINLATVFVMVTAENSNEMVMGALEFTPDAYVSKPFTKDLLGARLGRALRRREPLIPVASALSKQGPAVAVEALDLLLNQTQPNRLELLRIRAELAFSMGDLEGAEATCGEAMADKPLAWALTRRGQIAEARGDAAAAAALYRESIALTAHYMPAHDQLAALCERQGRAQEALEVLVAALERSPKSLRRQRSLARLATRLKRDELAGPAWERAIHFARQMGLPDAADYLGLIRVLVARGDMREARLRIKTMARRCAGDLQLGYWDLAARMLCLPLSDGAGLNALLAELDALLEKGPVPKRAGAALAEAVASTGELARYPALATLRDQEIDP
ncbi:response regulator [Thiorhodovibrio frisius]|uniref:Response regulator with CheY-like receiver, AAA-type ATPase, and DNA-binding domains n=1 Tax=Thiorhodovibrio frisius TaxID=631362 RepID=H8Z5T0_9GAMM|nr:response regulator [Thiorhodovibrio frisius]EIC19564.1 response regulator with CheY-like receiver, AAA-type ATPase, and DNA-binding domains [Thiorhodovibrio frisius]WPL20474.1 Chemotaxis protein CheY [Thiorhodovibrio frisius]